MSYADYGYTTVGPTGTAETINRAVEVLLQQHVAAGARLLDLGCGNGYFTDRLARSGYRAMGADASVSGIEVARRAYPDVPFHCGPAEALLQSGTAAFDAVVSIEVIEHCPSAQAFCTDLAACLRPGGSAIITTPYHGYLKNLAIAVLGRSDRHYNPLWEGGHIKFFSPATLRLALENAGLAVRSIARVGRIPAFAKSMVVHAVKPG